VEEAQWFYEDFIRPLDVSLPHLSLQQFSLKIFQHCPLFSQWSAQHYQTAFAEFMAYKQRVPVRGAIMLNDEMNEVVLVKGWKKSANWSFPRGKINKDEDDLDCAIREVYEETGLDLRTAGLVPERSHVKSIEMTMREQHMMLFVFRGIPKDTHFEARTRKEISKIEWYRLDDLPTFKKKGKQEGQDNMPNANKFYMVAPFLGHLKKWIASQKKHDAQTHRRQGSNLAAPPLVFEEESEIEGLSEVPVPLHGHTPSDLPEVNAHATQPSAGIQALFNNSRPDANRGPLAQPSHMPQVDAAKSNALLSLLKGPPASEMRASPQTPMASTSYMSPPSQPLVGRTSFNGQTELPTSPLPHRQSLPVDANTQPPLSAGFPFTTSSQPVDNGGYSMPMQPVQQRGEPDYIHQRNPVSDAPPASSLPKLTNHTKSLLDVFKGVSSPPPQQAELFANPGPPPNQSLLDILKASAPQTAIPTTKETVREAPTPAHNGSARPAGAHQNNLLNLFGTPKPAEDLAAPPVELPTGPASHKKPVDNKNSLLSLLREEAPRKARSRRSQQGLREGETSAIMSGPLDQPDFEAVSRRHRESSNGMGRTPLPTHRKLYDPNEPAPVKILARPQTPKSGKSPQPPINKGNTSSPKKTPRTSKKEREREREAARPVFQPQILRRPQPVENAASQGQPEPGSLAMSRGGSASSAMAAEGAPTHTETHKQSLLSLFGGNMPPPAPKMSQQSSRIVSPLSTSHLLSPKEDVPISAVEPISTRSRVGSLASVGSVPAAAARPTIEKRTTGAENKAFLLSYLTKMTSPEA
jgi:mRNA-decapping enzyme subunit 2